MVAHARLIVPIGMVIGSTALGVTPSFQSLGDLTGGATSSTASGISSDGQVVVGNGVPSSGTTHGFRWTDAGGMFDLNTLAGPSGTSYARATNGDGSIVVGYSTGPGFQVFIWSAGTGMFVLGELPGGANRGAAQGISDDGSVVVGSSSSVASGINGSEAFYWTAASGMVGMGDLPGGVFDSGATDVTPDGTVIVGIGSGEDSDGIPATLAFRWTQATGMVAIGDLPGGGIGSRALGVSANGLVVVGDSRSLTSAPFEEAFRWTEATGMRPLGFIGIKPGSTPQSHAYAASADGRRIVGTSVDQFGGTHAFLWTNSQGMRKLQDVLENTYGLDLSDWIRLDNAYDITPDGTTIVGGGFKVAGGHEAWIARIPAPPACDGDITGNGSTDSDDFNVLAQNFGAGPGATAAQGDLTGDGYVNSADFNVLAADFGCGVE